MALIVLVGFLAYQGIVPPVLACLCIALKGISMFMSVSSYMGQKEIDLTKWRRGGKDNLVQKDALDAQIDSLEAELEKY